MKIGEKKEEQRKETNCYSKKRKCDQYQNNKEGQKTWSEDKRDTRDSIEKKYNKNNANGWTGRYQVDIFLVNHNRHKLQTCDM